jgi:predicted N-acetyltransferase YhbS
MQIGGFKMAKVERANPNDFEEILEVSNRIFAGEDKNYFQTYHPALYKEGVNTATDHIIMRDEGKIKGIVGWFPSVMNVLGEKLEVCGVGTVCVEKDCRGKGYMRELMEELLREMEETNTPLAVLGGRRQRYEYYGFTPSAICSNFYFNFDNAKHIFSKDTEATYTFYTPNGSEKELFEKCVSLYERRKAYTERTADNFYDCLCNCRCKPLFINKNGEFAGYACISPNNAEIHEFEIEDNNDCCRMLKDYIAAFDLRGVSAKQIFHFEREKLNALTKVCEGVSTCGADSYYIQDYAKVITAFGNLKTTYTKIPDGETVIDIEGKQKIKLTVKDGKVSAVETTENADLTLKPLDAISIFFGQGAFTLKETEELPAFANALFPLPLFFSVPDMI